MKRHWNLSAGITQLAPELEEVGILFSVEYLIFLLSVSKKGRVLPTVGLYHLACTAKAAESQASR